LILLELTCTLQRSIDDVEGFCRPRAWKL
jgi:hypothetical protein